MPSLYRIFGAEMSPYSVKVRAYARYKQLPHQWLNRGGDNAAEYAKYAKIQIVPLVVTPEGEAIQDSTPIIERLERDHPEPSIYPQDPALNFLSALLEELADEWGNKWMFHYRWRRDIDQKACAMRLALAMNPAMDEATQGAFAEQIRTRMVSRVWFVGSSDATAPIIEETFHAALAQLDAHLKDRAYLFGARPSFADFALWGQIYNMWTDPTPGAIIEARAQNTLAWIQRMLWPKAEGEFETWRTLEPTLLPIIRDWAGELFLPWSIANAAALKNPDEEFEVTLRGKSWRQKPQKYHAKSLEALRAKLAATKDRSALDAILSKANVRLL
ncbi:MAG: glutathione S-transferase family protein [Alphaproteobacteria bacterium]|nr:glutathione S-transferase family protein [Alphaproteobacteria bacterium]